MQQLTNDTQYCNHRYHYYDFDYHYYVTRYNYRCHRNGVRGELIVHDLYASSSFQLSCCGFTIQDDECDEEDDWRRAASSLQKLRQ